MSTALTIPDQPNTSLALIREAMTNGADPQVLRELLAVKREWEADEAKKAYFFAISEFQRRAPIIEKADKAYDKMYARMDRIWRTVRPLFTELGLSCTWQACEIGNDGKICHVTGQLGHVLGHSVNLIMDVAIPELLKGQNAAQQIGSARTYAQRYAFCSALGLQTGEDDDGNGAGSQFVTNEQVREIEDLLNYFNEPEKEIAGLCNWQGVERLADIQASNFGNVVKQIKAKLAKK